MSCFSEIINTNQLTNCEVPEKLTIPRLFRSCTPLKVCSPRNGCNPRPFRSFRPLKPWQSSGAIEVRRLTEFNPTFTEIDHEILCIRNISGINFRSAPTFGEIYYIVPSPLLFKKRNSQVPLHYLKTSFTPSFHLLIT